MTQETTSPGPEQQEADGPERQKAAQERGHRLVAKAVTEMHLTRLRKNIWRYRDTTAMLRIKVEARGDVTILPLLATKVEYIILGIAGSPESDSLQYYLIPAAQFLRTSTRTVIKRGKEYATQALDATLEMAIPT